MRTCERRRAGVLGERRVSADADREPPASDVDGAPARAGPEHVELVGVDVLLVVAGGDLAVAVEDEGRDRPALFVSDRAAHNRGDPALPAGSPHRVEACVVRAHLAPSRVAPQEPEVVAAEEELGKDDDAGARAAAAPISLAAVATLRSTSPGTATACADAMRRTSVGAAPVPTCSVDHIDPHHPCPMSPGGADGRNR